MKYIQKSPEPVEFTDFKNTEGICFNALDGNDAKKKLKASLMDEQGYICCYCGKRLELETTIIEHLKPRRHFPELELIYENLLASCDGGQGDRSCLSRSQKSKIPSYCDSSKGDNVLNISPLNSRCETLFVYDTEGNIYSKEEDNNNVKDAIKILNLNNPVLKNLRKAAIAPYSDKNIFTENELNRYITFITNKIDGQKFLPFCHVIEYILKN